MKPEYLEKIMAKIDAFPSIPGSTVKLIKMLEDSETSVQAIEDVLRLDPGMTANVLKLTNSAYIGLTSKVGSVKRAIMMLGMKKIKQLVMTSCVGAVMDGAIPGYNLPAGELWRHSIAVSVAAEALSRELKLEDTEDIFTAALVHDVGKLILGQFIQDDLAAIQTAAGSDISFEVAEKAVLGIDHAEIGARILSQWSLPDDLVHAVRWHHDPESADSPNRTTDVVHVANVLCLMMGIGVGREGLQYTPSPEVTRRLGLKPFTLERVASQTLQLIEELSDVFSGE
jgi:putative nucleotidyltransferase with HDIG domain